MWWLPPHPDFWHLKFTLGSLALSCFHSDDHCLIQFQSRMLMSGGEVCSDSLTPSENCFFRGSRVHVVSKLIVHQLGSFFDKFHEISKLRYSTFGEETTCLIAFTISLPLSKCCTCCAGVVLHVTFCDD